MIAALAIAVAALGMVGAAIGHAIERGHRRARRRLAIKLAVWARIGQLRRSMGLPWADPRECCGVCGMRGTTDEPCDGGPHG